MAAVSFTTIARPNPGNVLLIEVPARVVAALGDKKRIPVNVTINGVTYRSTIAVYGGKFFLPAPRTVLIPKDLAGALTSAKLRPSFEALSFTARNEHVQAVTGAKRPETRAARIAKVVASLRAQ